MPKPVATAFPRAVILSLAAPLQSRFVLSAKYRNTFFDLWGYTAIERVRGNPIALCESAVVLTTLFQFRHQLAGQHIIWFLDNTVALSGYVKGMSGSPILCSFIAAVHLLMLRFNMHVWFEFIPSDDNWADGISRVGFSDPFVSLLESAQHDIDWSPMSWPMEAEDLRSTIMSI